MVQISKRKGMFLRLYCTYSRAYTIKWVKNEMQTSTTTQNVTHTVFFSSVCMQVFARYVGGVGDDEGSVYGNGVILVKLDHTRSKIIACSQSVSHKSRLYKKMNQKKLN